MTLTSEYSLQEAIDDAIQQTNNGSTRDVIRYLQMHYRKVLDDNSLTIEGVGLGSMIRAYRKKPTLKDRQEKIRNLCLDFGLDYLDLDDEISVPVDMNNVLNSECDWPDIEDATVDDLDKHLILRDAQEVAHAARTLALRTFRQAAAQVVPGRTDIPIRELREIVRGKK
jgi:hypothetical protein